MWYSYSYRQLHKKVLSSSPSTYTKLRPKPSKQTNRNKVVICSSSYSILQKTLQMFTRESTRQEIQNELTELQKKDIVVMWVPGHVIIAGNENAENRDEET